jgi:PII-like signaling protein
MMIISIGTSATTAAALDALGAQIDDPLATIERVHILKRDGERIAGVPVVADTDASGLNVWQKLMIYTGEQSRDDGQPIYQQLVRSLREAGAAGATCLRGIWGYHGAHQPHGDRFFSVRRHVPVVTVVVDAPERIRELYPIVDRLTRQTGLVTSEVVPAFRATGTGMRRGGLRIADPFIV